MKMTVTVTLDGRVLVAQGRNIVELADLTDTTNLRGLLEEASEVQRQLWGEPVGTPGGKLVAQLQEVDK